MVDFVCDYYNNVEGMPVRSSVEVSSQLLSYTARLRQLPARLIRACATEEHALLAVQLAYCLHPAVCMAEAVTTAAAMHAVCCLLPAACTKTAAWLKGTDAFLCSAYPCCLLLHSCQVAIL